VTTNVVISPVTFASQELGLRLNHRWRFVTIEEGKVLVHGEPFATFTKQGGRVTLGAIGSRDVVRWIAWAIQTICPEAEAIDEEASPPRIVDEPMSSDEVEKTVLDGVARRHDAIAKEADPSGNAHEAVALVTHLVKRGLLELAGPIAPVVRAVAPVLREVDEDIGTRLEDVLVDLDEVEELYADADQLSKIVSNNDHIFR
jgi:hypothetical protein